MEPEPVDGEDEDPEPLTVETDEEFAELLASVDAAITQADRTLAGEPRPPEPPSGERDPLVYDLDRDEDARLAEWRVIVDQTRDLPPTLAALDQAARLSRGPASAPRRFEREPSPTART